MLKKHQTGTDRHVAFENKTKTDGRSIRVGEVIETIHGALRRRLWLLVGITGLGTLVALVLILCLHAKYDAVTRLRIDPSRSALSQDQSENSLNSEAIETEIGVMTSQEVSREVVRRLNLDQDPEFSNPVDVGKPTGSSERLNAVAGRVLRNLSVGRDKLSYIIALDFRSRDPQKAAKIANAYADTYMDMRVRSQVGTSTRQADFFRRRLKELSNDVNAADSRLADYRARAGISENSGTGTIADQQIAPLSVQLATAEAEAAAAQSNASVAHEQVARGELDAVPEVRKSTVIGDLRRQRAEIVRDLGEAQSRYGELFPEMIRVRTQLAAIDKQIHDEAARVVASLQAQALAAQAQVNALRSTMRSLESQRATNTRASAQAERLEREAMSVKATYDRMSQLSLESTQTARGAIAQAEVVDRARAPSKPTSPNRPLLAVLSAAVSFAAALAVVILLEIAQNGLCTAAEIAERYNLPVLGAIVRQRFGGPGDGSPSDGIEIESATLYSESIRILQSSIYNRSDAPEVLAITSALPSEGKTTTALSLARILAIGGTKTLLIDCDIRNSGLRELFGSVAGKGLLEVINGDISLNEAVIADRVDGLDVLTVSESLFTSRNIFGGDRMTALLAEAKGLYGAVLLDLPPALGVADTRTLSALADMITLIVRWGKTSPRAVDAAVESLSIDGLNLAGIVFTMVTPQSEAAGGVYYSGKYASYYRKS